MPQQALKSFAQRAIRRVARRAWRNPVQGAALAAALVFTSGVSLGFGIDGWLNPPTARPAITQAIPEPVTMPALQMASAPQDEPLPVRIYRSDRAVESWEKSEASSPVETLAYEEPLPDGPGLPAAPVANHADFADYLDDIRAEARRAALDNVALLDTARSSGGDDPVPATRMPDEAEPAVFSLTDTDPLAGEGIDTGSLIGPVPPGTQLAALTPAPDRPPVSALTGPPLWQQRAVTVDVDYSRPMVAIVIDDLGLDQKRTRQAIALPGPLTMSFIPYGHNLERHVENARNNGHEIMLHLPMEPVDAAIDPGPNALLTTLDRAERVRRLTWALQRFDGYVGVNNHMGSRFTAWPAGMLDVLGELQRRGLLFLDSITSQQSVGYRMAGAIGMPHATRDIFLDHDLGPSSVESALQAVERMAREKGYAIAIGHPHDVTMAALGAWLDGIEEKGIQIVPVSAIVRRNSESAGLDHLAYSHTQER